MTPTLAGARITELTAVFPWSGSWAAEADLETQVDVSGVVSLSLPGITLTCAVDPRATGAWQYRTRVRVVGGLGWSSVVSRKDYTSDAGVSTQLVVGDVARECGEELYPTLLDVPERLGTKFVRKAGPASSALSWAIGDVPWWVDADGKTHVGGRVATEAGALELLDFNPRTKVAMVACDDIRAVGVGTILRDTRLARPLLVREVTLSLKGPALRLECWGKDL